MKHALPLICVGAASLAAADFAQAEILNGSITDVAAVATIDGSTDPVPANGTFVVNSAVYTGQVYPAGESPAQALDLDSSTKFLSFWGAGLNDDGEWVNPRTGMVITFDAPTTLTGYTATSANDAESRDPSMIAIYGINKTGTAADVAYGALDDFTLVYEGATGMDVSTPRLTEMAPVDFAETDAYDAYMILFTDIVRHDGHAPTWAQIADLELRGNVVPEPASLGLVALGGLMVAGRRRRKA